ncbi:MAG TPA: hypothetical protein VN605_03030, partial [Thermoanaerobaculia bacterium]|nr:hypothetical protein [Thermoanaerobaculia bacterium]
LAPPRTRDELTTLRRFQPPFADAHPNPHPDARTLGCYSVQMSPGLPHASRVPRKIELTAEFKRQFGLHELYWIRSGGALSPHSSWRPWTEDEIEVDISDGFSGWTFAVWRTKSGFAGPASWMNDTLERSEGTVRLERIACGTR